MPVLPIPFWAFCSLLNQKTRLWPNLFSSDGVVRRTITLWYTRPHGHSFGTCEGLGQNNKSWSVPPAFLSLGEIISVLTEDDWFWLVEWINLTNYLQRPRSIPREKGQYLENKTQWCDFLWVYTCRGCLDLNMQMKRVQPTDLLSVVIVRFIVRHPLFYKWHRREHNLHKFVANLQFCLIAAFPALLLNATFPPDVMAVFVYMFMSL